MVKVFVAIPTVGTNCDAQVYALRTMEKLYKDKIEFIYPEDCVRRIFHDFARNEMVEEFLKTEADVLWFLDSDIGPPTTLFDEYLARYEEWDVAGAPYPLFISQRSEDGPQVVYAVYNGTNGVGMRPASIPMEGTGWVDGIATGCLMIKRHIFEGMQKPYFEFKYNSESRELTEGEDLGFCKKVNKMGYKFFIDYTKVCKHYKTVCLRDVNDYAMTYARNQIKAYDAIARQQLDELKVVRKTPKVIEPPKPKIWLQSDRFK